MQPEPAPQPPATATATADRAAGVRSLPATEAAPRLEQDEALVLDIRTPPEVAQVRLPRAVELDYYSPNFPQRLAELDRDVPILLYCRSGSRSGHALGLFRELGFTDVIDVRGGIIAWAQAGLPLEQ